MTADTTDRELATTAAPFGLTGLVTVGMTRAQVVANLPGQEVVIPDQTTEALTVGAAYCGARIHVAYADQAVAGMLDGVLTDDDTVARVTTLPGFPGHTDTGLRRGDAQSAVLAAYMSDTDRQAVVRPYPEGTRDLWPVSGRDFLYGPAGVETMSVQAGYAGTAATSLTPNYASRRMVAGATNINARFPMVESGYVSFSEVKTLVGQPEEQGFGVLDTYDIAFLNYFALGIRFVALASGTNLNAQNVGLLYLVAPFAGTDANGLGIGSSLADWDARVGSTFSAKQAPVLFQGNMYERYQVGSIPFVGALTVAVAFLPDAQCVQRTAIIIMNFPPI